MKSRIFTLLKILATLAIIIFLFTRVDLQKMAQYVARANPLLLFSALVLYFLAIFIGAVKWRVLVHAQEMRASTYGLFVYSLVGLFFGNLLPSNVGGDVVRAYGLVRSTGRAEAAAISVLVDRLMGLTAFLGSAVVMAIVAATMLARGSEMEQIEIATVVAASVLIFGSALLFSRRVAERFKWIFDLKQLAPVRPTALRVFDALQVYRRSYRALALNLALSVGIVLITTFVWYSVALALGANAPLVYFLLFNPLIAFVLLIPISFNGLGPKEATAVFFFGLAGVPSEQALAMSLIFHLIIVLTSLPGGILWWRERALAPPQSATASSE